MRRTFLVSLLLLLAATASPARSQDIGKRIGVLTGANAERFVGPLARGLGHALTAGFASSADPHGLLDFDLGIRLTGAAFPVADETFQVVLPSRVTFGGIAYQDPYEANHGGRSPTVAGEGAGVELRPRLGSAYRAAIQAAGGNPDSNEFTASFPNGLAFPGAPFAVIEGALGIGLGTQIMARVTPTIDAGRMVGVDGMGDASAFGFGVMHNLTRWLPIPTPSWDVSVVWGTQRLELGNYAEARGSTLGLVASAGVGPLSFFAHGATYRADVDVDYTVSNPRHNPALPSDGTRVAFRSGVSRTKRLAVGAALDLPVLKLSAEYGMGDYRTLSGKAAIALR